MGNGRGKSLGRREVKLGKPAAGEAEAVGNVRKRKHNAVAKERGYSVISTQLEHHAFHPVLPSFPCHLHCDQFGLKKSAALLLLALRHLDMPSESQPCNSTESSEPGLAFVSTVLELVWHARDLPKKLKW